MTSNLFLMTDTYKLSHKDQYPKGTTKIYSYLTARGSRIEGVNEVVFFGLQYYIQKYFMKVPTQADFEYFKEITEGMLGKDFTDFSRFQALIDLGYYPLKIKAVPEGTKVGPQNVLMTIENTHPDFFWLVNFVETLLLKVWYPTTTATVSHAYYELCKKYALETCMSLDHLPFQVHDFGYRAVSSEESAQIGAAGHLLSFRGTDTIAGVVMLKEYYDAGIYGELIGASVPASEHSVMCAWSKNKNDHDAIKNMLTTYPTGIVSIVADTYDLWRAIKMLGSHPFYEVEGTHGRIDRAGEYEYGLRDLVNKRDGKVVVRPDSGDPVKIICGDPDADPKSAEGMGVIKLLDQYFGSTVNDMGYKILNPKIGCIYGDAIFYERCEEILKRLKKAGYASSNIVFGIGGILLQHSTRDTFNFSIKATYAEVNGEKRNLQKDPITDSGKRSASGKLALRQNDQGTLYTVQNCSDEEEENSLLNVVFEDGEMKQYYNLEDIRFNLMGDKS